MIDTAGTRRRARLRSASGTQVLVTPPSVGGGGDVTNYQIVRGRLLRRGVHSRLSDYASDGLNPAVGARSINTELPGRRVVPRASASHGVRSSDANTDVPPFAIVERIGRRIRHEILTRQFIGDFAVNAGQFASFLREERRSSCLLSEVTHHEVAVAVTAGSRHGA